MQVVILAGGMGTRLQEYTTVKPKPMIEIGGRPVLCHLMDVYSSHGFNEFVLALGYKGELIKQYFLERHALRHDLTVNVESGAVAVHPRATHEEWTVHLVDTGISTATGGRLKRLTNWIRNEPFLMTYGDGLSDVNIPEVVDFHRRHGRLATLVAVRPPPRFGALLLEGDRVASFREKSCLDEGWINGGFFVLEPRVLEYIGGDTSVFEREPMERLAADGQLLAYRHEGFWQCMDTLKDVQFLEQLAASGDRPWLRRRLGAISA
jgi:glucose-1-phosphate cytidylyltransferase